ncbi:TrmH family RNA methyltransferase [Polaribacter uvawellassae]|uniref:TrmH family RNA methyltransferase n=1 Tax=Polaribacter uvawellassae TaxID=3133495 RepID=UPI0032190165
MNLSKNHIKLITSLQQKKYRQKHKLFVAEGVKIVNELLNSNFKVAQLFITDDFEVSSEIENTIIVTEKELKKISQLKTPNKVVGLFKIPETLLTKNTGIIIALDAINDPGNLGTIIRLCDWFGVQKLVCSTTTVDCYNQKVVQASMGSLTRIEIIYTDLVEYLNESELPIFIADMEGENVYKSDLPKEAILVMGNEANGISDEIRKLVDAKISIPRFGNIQETESLNVATATAILLSEFKRNV